MTIYKQPGSPHYCYDFYFEKRRYQASTHLRNETVAQRADWRLQRSHRPRLAGKRQETGRYPNHRFAINEVEPGDLTPGYVGKPYLTGLCQGYRFIGS
jgi:hypothetical protein